MSIGINFGSATGGTGFDVAATVASIVAVQRTPEMAWTTRITALKAQDAAPTSLGTNLSSLSTALESLTSFDGVFAQKSGAVSDSASIALTSADSSASSGSHTLTVQSLALTSTQHSSTVAAGMTLAGTFTLQVGTGAVQSIALTDANHTVAGLAASINALQAGVTATAITDSNGTRLSLVSAASGAASEIRTGGSVTNSADGTPLSFTETQAGTDAAYTLDGIALNSASNSVTGALTGVSFQLLAVSTRPVTLQIANDTAAASTALSTFVTAYNSLTTALAAQEGKDTAGAAEPLFGDRTVALVQQQLAGALTFANAHGGSSIAQLGISLGLDGKLSLSQSTLSAALQTNFSGVTSFFQTSTDFGQNFTTALNGLSSTGTGALALRALENTTEETQLADNTSKLETRLTAYQASLTSQLTTANQILQEIPQKLNEFNQIYAAISGYKSSN